LAATETDLSRDEMIEIRALAQARLKEILQTPRTNYEENGTRYDWAEYQSMLLRRIAQMTEEIDKSSAPGYFTTGIIVR